MSYKNWSYNPNKNAYIGTYEISKRLPAGLYVLDTSSFDDPMVTRQKIKDDEITNFGYGPMKRVLDEVAGFWDNAEKYKQLGITHKRGILLYGPAGCGKTGIISGVIKNTIARDGIVVNMVHVNNFRSAVPMFRQIENGRPLVVIVEDIDNVCEGQEEDLLEAMDGASSLGDGLVFVATTNYLDKVPDRIKARPSRIDTLVEVPPPDLAQRLEYLKFLYKPHFGKTESDLAMWAKETDGFSLADIKELVVSTVVYRRLVSETIARLRSVKKDSSEEEEE